MTIRKRLGISYMVLVLFPFSLFISTSYVMTQNYILKLDQLKENVQSEYFLQGLYSILSNSPQKLLEDEVVKDLINRTHSPDFISAYITIDGQLYKSIGDMRKIDLRDLHDHRYINSWRFILDDGRVGNIHFLNNISTTKSFPLIFFFPILFYVILISLLSYITSSTITRPLKRLKIAATSIKNEEFDIDLRYKGDDEIHSVFAAFDDMRIRLKDIVHKQLNYEKNRVELISNMSHDLKTPVTAIKGYIEGLRDGVANTPDKVKRYHETIYKKVNLLDKLIEDLFLYSKLDLKTLNFSFQCIDSKAFIQDIVEEVTFENESLEIGIEMDDTPLFINADPIHLQRVVHNIIGNAVKYNDKETCRINISLRPVSDMLRLSFEDNGIGINQKDANQIFKRFYRSDPARSSSKEGSGLGLAISKQIVVEHHGEIFANSNLKEGLTITIKLPLYNKA